MGKNALKFLVSIICFLSVLLPVSAFAADADEFVVTSSNRLMLKDSHKPYCFSSTNQYYLFYKPVAMVDEVFADAQAMGINVIRTWGFCDGMYKEGISFQPTAGAYDESGFARMDLLIKKARERNIRLIIPLVNNWSDFGGMGIYATWAGAANHDDFYTNATCKTLYKNYVQHFLNRVNTLTGIRYKDDPTILIWELANEPRCQSDTTGNTLQAWIDEMAAYIKSIDSNHLVSTGEEGWYSRGGYDWRYNGYEGCDYIRNNQSPYIDICSFHLLFNDSIYDEALALTWIREHADDAHFIVGKPVYCGEMGYKVSRTDPGATEQMAARNRLYSDWYAEFCDKVIDGGGFWLLSADSYEDWDNYTVYYPGDADTCSIIGSFSASMAARRTLSYFPPILLPEGDKIINEQQPIEFQLTVSNPSGVPLSFTGINMPFGATLSSGGYFSWPSAVAGNYGNIELSVSYNTFVNSTKFNLQVVDVNGDNTPQIAYIPGIVADKNVTLDNAVDLWAYTTDDNTPVQNIVFTAEGDDPADGVTLDSNRYIDIVNPAISDRTHTINVTATDENGLVGSMSIFFIVKNNAVIRVPADYSTITDAMSHALWGDTISVAPGTYTGGIIIGSYINLVSETGAASTIIDATGKSYGVTGGDMVKGFTIRNASGPGVKGVGKVLNNIIENNSDVGVYGRGWGIAPVSLIANNIIRNNNSTGAGGGIMCDNISPEIVNNVITGNTSFDGGGMYLSQCQNAFISNNIIVNNSGTYSGGIRVWGASVFLLYNDVYNNSPDNYYGTVPDEGSISVNPLFVGGADYHLQGGSACINTGNPDPAYNDRDSTRNDMGIYGGPYSTEAPVNLNADFTASPLSGYTPLAVSFTSLSTGTITSYSWSFGDGGTSAEQNPSHVYNAIGAHTVTLTVTGPGGTDTETKANHITVSYPAPAANFTASPTSGAAPLTVNFADTSTGTVTSYSWNFGDGGTSTQQNPPHLYNAAGTYTVTLTVTGPGGTDSEMKINHITVSEPAPIADFSASPTSGTVPLTVNFTDFSTGTVTSYSWNFGDGGTSTQQNPPHLYNAAGTYTVTLTVTGPGGSNIATKTNYIMANPPTAYLLVPSEYPTIGTAMSYAVADDIILVAPGTYNESVYMENGVTLMSRDGAAVTTINGLIEMPAGSSEKTILQGFTISNANGFGINFPSGFDSRPIIQNNIIQNNLWNGISIYQASPLIQNNIIRNNHMGGIVVGSASPVIQNNVIQNNDLDGIGVYGASPKIYNNIIKGNQGGGMYSDGSMAEIINNIITGNTAARGGGICTYNGNDKIFNNIVTNNHASEYGGGIKGWNLGAGFAIGYNDVWNNSATLGEQNYGTCPAGDGAIEANPLFKDPVSGDYGFLNGSPCINTGNPNSVYNDKDSTRNDMGIYGGPYAGQTPLILIVDTDTVWPSGTYNYDSVIINAGVTLTVNGPASLRGSIKGQGNLIVQGGTFTATTIQAGSVVMRNGGSVRTGSTSGGSLILG